MKRKLTVILSLLMSLFFAFAAFAGEYDLASADSQSMDVFREKIESGVRVFDQTGTLSRSEANELQGRLLEIEKTYGQMMVVVLVENQEVSSDMDVYADRLYTDGKLGTGSDRDGVLLVLDLGDEAHRGVHIYAQNGAMRIMTDRAIDQVYDEYDGGMVELLVSGAYYEALQRYADALEALYSQGVQNGQYNYDPVTGEKDYYKAPRRLKLWQVLAALLIAGLSAFLPVNSIKNRYAMTTEKRQAKQVNLAYRATAAFTYATAADALINTRTVHIPIPRQEPSEGGGGTGFGGGQSTMHRSGGGGHHTSGGRKF